MTHRALNFLTAFMATAALVAAQNSAPAPAPAAADAAPLAASGATSDASSIVLAAKQKDTIPQPPADSDGETRGVSAGVAAALASGMPKYSPPKPTPTPPNAMADLRDIDKPKNEIKRLPKYVVQESRPPVFRDRDLFNASGLADLSFKSHPGLNFGNVLGLNTSTALQMYQDDQRLKNMDDLYDTAHSMSLGGDAAEGRYILQESQETYMRDLDGFGPTGLAGSNAGGWGK
jgi:hypothetical protein